MSKKYLFLFCFALFAFRAQAESEYIVTEAELIKLEQISQHWEMQTQKHLSTVQSLKAQLLKVESELKKSEMRSKLLNTILEEERTKLQNLQTSYAKLESDLLIEIDDLKLEQTKDKIKKQNLWTAVIILSSIVALFGAYLIFKIVAKFKI